MIHHCLRYITSHQNDGSLLKYFSLLVVLFVSISYVEAVVVPFQYPLFKQCDKQWGNEWIGTSKNTTICDVGCLMSSVSMAINGKGIQVNHNQSDPEVLNSWLVQNGGYYDDTMLQESVVPGIAPTRIAWVGPLYNNTALSPSSIKSYLNDNKTIVIINVMKGRHFVLVVGYDDGDVNFYVNDPGFDTQYYTYDDIVGYRIFTMV